MNNINTYKTKNYEKEDFITPYFTIKNCLELLTDLYKCIIKDDYKHFLNDFDKKTFIEKSLKEKFIDEYNKYSPEEKYSYNIQFLYSINEICKSYTYERIDTNITNYIYMNQYVRDSNYETIINDIYNKDKSIFNFSNNRDKPNIDTIKVATILYNVNIGNSYEQNRIFILLIKHIMPNVNLQNLYSTYEYTIIIRQILLAYDRLSNWESDNHINYNEILENMKLLGIYTANKFACNYLSAEICLLSFTRNYFIAKLLKYAEDLF